MKNLAPTGATYDGTINGTYTPAPPLIRAKKSPCMDFVPANTNFISLANPISGATDFSIVCWVNADAWQKMFFSRASAGGTYFYIDIPGALDYSGIYPGYTGGLPRRLPVNTTYMTACTRSSASGRVTLYVNGGLYFSGPMGAMPVDANAFIGKYFDGTLLMDGRIDNFLIYNTALTPDQIWSLYRSSVPR
jgi:hypothetical protein